MLQAILDQLSNSDPNPIKQSPPIISCSVTIQMELTRCPVFLINTVPSAQPIAHPIARRIPIIEICPVKLLELITPTPINPSISPKILTHTLILQAISTRKYQVKRVVEIRWRKIAQQAYIEGRQFVIRKI